MYRSKAILLFSFAFLTFLSVHAQKKLSGIVTEKNTGSPVPFATVQAKNAKSTLTNGNGEFEIDVPELPAAVTISHLNYGAVTVQVSSAETALKIALEPKVMTLKEVTVGNPATAIMQDASDKASLNAKRPNYGKAFLRQVAYDDDKPVYLNEIFFDAEWRPFGITAWNPTQARHMESSKGMSYTNFSFYFLILSGYLPNNLHKKPLTGKTTRVDSLYTFKLAGTYDQNGQEIAKVGCTPKPFVKGLRFEGFYYVNTTTNDVLQIEGHLLGLNFTGTGPVSVKNKETTFTAQYRLNKAGENVLDYALLNTSNRLKVLGLGVKNTNLFSTLYMTDDENTDKGSLKELNAKIDDSNLVKAMTFNADFWKKNQGIKRTEKEKAAIEILEKIPQVNNAYHF